MPDQCQSPGARWLPVCAIQFNGSAPFQDCRTQLTQLPPMSAGGHQRNGEKLDPLIGPPLCYVGQTRCSITRFPSWWVKKLTAICCGKICFRHFAQGGAQSSCARKVSLSLWTLTKSWACPETTRPQKIQFEVMVLSSQLIQPGLPSAPPVRTRASLLLCFWFTIGPFAWDHAVCRATAPSRWPARW